MSNLITDFYSEILHDIPDTIIDIILRISKRLCYIIEWKKKINKKEKISDLLKLDDEFYYQVGWQANLYGVSGKIKYYEYLNEHIDGEEWFLTSYNNELYLSYKNKITIFRDSKLKKEFEFKEFSRKVRSITVTENKIYFIFDKCFLGQERVIISMDHNGENKKKIATIDHSEHCKYLLLLNDKDKLYLVNRIKKYIITYNINNDQKSEKNDLKMDMRDFSSWHENLIEKDRVKEYVIPNNLKIYDDKINIVCNNILIIYDFLENKTEKINLNGKLHNVFLFEYKYSIRILYLFARWWNYYSR